MTAPAAHAGSARPFDALRRLIDSRPKRRAGETCEMCAREVPEEHSHLVNLESRNLLCTCRPCYLLFTHNGAAQGRYRAVPERYLRDPRFQLSEAQWDSFQIPVRMAFFFYNSSVDRVVAFYPSPAGATESTLPLAAWQDLIRGQPALTALEPDVEALLVYGGRGAPFACYLAPIDACYELAGLVKRHWRGFDGGEAVHEKVSGFFAKLEDRCREVTA